MSKADRLDLKYTWKVVAELRGGGKVFRAIFLSLYREGSHLSVDTLAWLFELCAQELT